MLIQRYTNQKTVNYVLLSLLMVLIIHATSHADITPVSDRTSQVRDAIVAAVPNIDAAADVTETHLAAITRLNLRAAGISALQSGDFSGMTGLTNINLYNNQLSSLPDGIFEGLTALTTLRLGSNVVDPMSLIVVLEEVGEDQFKVVIPTGAPFDIVLPINVINGSISSGTTTITIPKGSLESASFAVSRTPDTSGDLTVEIGTLPGLPRNHYGYTFARSTACNRSPQVQRAIVNAVPGVNDCREVTDDHLAAIQTLNLEYAGLSTLRSDDFSGLTSLSTLYLGNNNLTTLPVDIFSGLSSLTDLYIQNNKLNSLPEDVFSSLSSVRQLNLHSNQLTSLPKNLFSGLPSLTQIFLNDNKLTTLDPDIFSNVSTLKYLYLYNNSLTTLPANLFSKITSLEQLLLNNNQLGNLPTGIFSGMSSPTLLWIQVNPIITLPLTISLEKVGETQFKVTVPAGAPFDMDLSLTITNGSINGGITSTTITAGSVESDAFTVTRTAGTLDAVTVDIGTLPTLPTNHFGYNLVKLSAIPLVVLSGVNSAPVFTEGTSTTRSVAENTAANVNIGTAVTATDADNDTLIFTLGGTDAASYEIDSATGQLKTNATLDYETKNTYSVTLTVSDGSLTDNITVNISVTDIDETPPNRAPIFVEGDSTTRAVVQDAQRGVNIGTPVLATDADDDTLTYTLGGTDAATFDIDGTTGQLKTMVRLDVETKPFYTVIVTASDDSLTDTITVTINIEDVEENNPPVFTEGDSTIRTIAENTAASTNIGTAITATDADNDTLTYTLGGTDAASFDIIGTSGQLKTSVALDYETKSSYAVTVFVSDGKGGTDSINVTINITDITENRAPVFTEGENTSRSVAENTAADTNIGTAIAATDADNDSLTYTLGGTDAASFDIVGTSGQLKTSVALDYETKSSYAVTVYVSDGKGGTDSITVTINITDITENRAPVFIDGENTSRSVAENTAADTNIGTAIAATDADNDSLTYTLGGTDAASFAIVDTSGQLKTSVALNYETKSSYSVTVYVSDGSLTGTISVTISVTDIDETPPNRPPVFVEGDSTTRAVAQDAERGVNIGTPILATDADDDTLTYTLGGTDAATFDIEGTTGQLKTKVRLDVETKPFYTVIVTASDDSLTDTITVTINIEDVEENNPPVFTEGDSTIRTIAENTAASTNIGTAITATDEDNDTLTYTLGGTDAASFAIDHTNGQLKTKATLDYETENTYTVTVTVSDSNQTDTINVTISVTDVDENRAPVFTDGENTTRSVAENTATDTNIGAAITATDEDNDTLTYTLGGTDAASFAIDHTNGQLKTKATLDYETKNTYTVTVTVSDSNQTGTINVTISVTDVDENRAPVFTDGENTTLSVAENTATNTNIGTAVAATDADNDTLTYTLSGTDAASFAIVDTSGQLKTSATLDYETKSSYAVTVYVSDGKGGTDSINVTISVTDVDENRAPVFTDGENTTLSVAENTATNTNIGTAVAATDADNDTLTYTLGGTDAASFAIVGTSGQLKTGVALDYETKSSYSVTVYVSDGKGGTDSINVTISVIDVDENRAPVFIDGENTSRSVTENTAADTNIGTAIAATDADNDTLTYTLSGTDAASFAIVGTSGQLKTGVALDYETKSSYSVTVYVSDGKGGTDSITVTISVIDVDENRAPVFTEGENTSRTVAENTATDTNIGTAITATDADNDTLTYTLSGTDAASFAIVDTSGQLKTSATLDYETKSSYAVTVYVSDGKGGTDSINVTISVTDVDENRAPVFTDGENTTLSVAENTATNTNIGTAVAATDADNDTLTYTLGGTDAASFAIVGTSGQLKTGVALDYETKSSYAVTVYVSDGKGGTDSINVTITVTDVTENRAPVFTDGENTTRSVEENTATDTNIGTAITATDADNDTLTYTLGGTDAASFAIVNMSGQLKTNGTLDYETKASYAVTLTVSDGSLTDTIGVTITVTDIDESTAMTMFTSVCDRTPQVRDAIVAAVGVDDCSEVTEEHLARFNVLDLISKGITSLKVGDFDGLSLYRLNLDANDLSSLPDGIFDELTTLRILDLRENELSSLPSGIFDENTALTALELSNNDFSSLPDGIFDKLTVLKSLNLSGNDLSPMPDGIFDKLTKLTYLNLSFNDLSPMLDGIFDKLTALTELNLSGNGISPLHSGIFDEFPALTQLFLNQNGISSLPDGIFDELTTLTALDLGNNDFSSLPDGIFDKLTALTHLFLSNNSNNDLSSLPDGIFDKLTALTELDLSGNELSSLPEGIFDELTVLQMLYLNNNDLSSLPEGIFDKLTALTLLALGQNGISSLAEGIFDELTALTNLHLWSNDLSSLAEGIFNKLTSLTRLNLGRNTVDPLPLTVSLDKVSDGQFKAVAPTGAPFDIVLPLTVANGSISGVTSVTISTGKVLSNTVTVTRTAGTTAAVTVDFGTLPSIPSSHTGYTLVKPTTGLPLAVITAVGGAPTLVSNTNPLVPEVTAVMPNYPNPFNPETWIPYQLANPSNVVITIYDMRGNVVRELDLGHQRVGFYTSRGRAAHWDGRNKVGEKVSNGIYIYKLQADNLSILRKMVILK